MQGFIEKDARVITRKWSAGGIGAVHARREPNDTKLCFGVTECRHRPGKIVGVLFSYLFEETGESRALHAVGIETIGLHWEDYLL